MQSGDDSVDAYPEQGEQQDFCPQGVPEPLPDRIRQRAGHCQRRQEERPYIRTIVAEIRESFISVSR